MAHDLIQTREQLARLLARVTDNDGATVDRYSVYFRDGDVLGLSGSPSHPQGFSQWSEYDPGVCFAHVLSGEERTVRLSEMPDDLVTHIIGRVNEGYRDWVEGEVAKNPYLYSSRGEGADDEPVLDRAWLLDVLEEDFEVPDDHPLVMNEEELL